MIILYLILIALGAICYRLGGADKTGKWYDFLCNTKTRDFGVPALALLSMWALHKWHWSLWLCAPLMFGAMTTYWKCLNPFFGQTTEDCHWWNWLVHGTMIGLAFLPYGYFTHCSAYVVCRALAMGLLMMCWSEANDNVVWEENGRGALIICTLYML